MSEYIELEREETDDPHILILESNVLLTDEVEEYDSAESMEEGSPFVQAIAYVPGIIHLHIDQHTMTITRDPDIDWYTIVEDIRAALVDFFL